MSDEPPFRRTPNPPVERASTVLIERAEDLYGQEPPPYGRFGHTVHRDLRAAFTKLAGGADTTLVSSGLQACTSAILALVKAGDHVLISDSVYGPNRGFCQTTLKRLGVQAEFYDPHMGADIANLMRPNTTLVFLESPGSLTLEIQDVPAITAAAHAAGALTVIDDTWSGGVFLKPLALGVDVVAHAATKYPSGASVVIAVGQRQRSSEEWWSGSASWWHEWRRCTGQRQRCIWIWQQWWCCGAEWCICIVIERWCCGDCWCCTRLGGRCSCRRGCKQHWERREYSRDWRCGCHAWWRRTASGWQCVEW